MMAFALGPGCHFKYTDCPPPPPAIELLAITLVATVVPALVVYLLCRYFLH